jgi:hypothetical protein
MNKNDYITGYDIAEGVAEELNQALLDKVGIKEPDESAIREHARCIECKDGGLEYWWDDVLLIKQVPLLVTEGVRIIRDDKGI